MGNGYLRTRLVNREGKQRCLSEASGFTLVEILLVSAIIGVVATFIHIPINTFLRGSQQSVFKTRALDVLRPVDVNLETDLLEMVELRVAKADRIEFIVDSNRMPTYMPTESNLANPDDDGDALSWVAPADWWKRGNDLDDDDDDGDGKLDARMAYSYRGNQLSREVSFNEGPVEIIPIAKELSGFEFSFFGSTKRAGGTAMDTNMDGIVTAQEIDGLLPPLGVGDGSGALDTPEELRAVVYIKVRVICDINLDGKVERILEKNVAPPLLNFRTPRL